MERRTATVRVQLWLETSDGLLFGVGRALLLAKIEEFGSLKKAADDLGMSYRAAWGKIKETEKILGDKLIVQPGTKREGYQLTELGHSLKEEFMCWFEQVEEEAIKKAKERFPWSVKRFTEELDQEKQSGPVVIREREIKQ